MSKLKSNTLEAVGNNTGTPNITLAANQDVTCEKDLQVDGNLTVTGTIPADKLTGTAAAINGSNLTNLPAANITGTLPAIDGSNLTGIVRVPKENLVINGDFRVWQRGTDDTSDVVSGYCGPDRWKKVWYGGTVIGKRIALTTGTPYDEGFRYSFQQKVTSASTGTDRYSLFQYLFEATDLATSGWKYVDSSSKIRVQFWAKSSLAGKYWVEFQSQDGTKRAYPYSFNLSADTWTKISYAIPGDSNITINNDGGAGGKLTIYTHLGTDYTNDSGSATATWKNQDGNASTEDYDQNWLNTANATWEITGVQVTVGEDAGDFQHRSYADEWRRCERYYQRLGAGSEGATIDSGGDMYSSTIYAVGFGYDSDDVKFLRVLPTRMKSAPSVTAKPTAAVLDVSNGQQASGNNTATIQLNMSDPNQLDLGIDTDASLNGGAVYGLYMYDAAGYLDISAEL